MRPLKMKNGTAFILENGEECPAGEICFLDIEWEFIKREAKSRQSDPEEHKAFWECLLEAKRTIPGFVHMPTNFLPKEEPKRENKSQFMETNSGKISQEILEQLRGRNECQAEKEKT